MTPPTPPHATLLPLPRSLAQLLEAAGFRGLLLVGRQDEVPMTLAEEQTLAAVLEGYELGHQLQPTPAQVAEAVLRELAREQEPKATGTEG